MLRRYVRQTDLIEDIRQETLLRVLQMIQREELEPQHLEAFVFKVAKLVSYEMMRVEHRYCQPAEDLPEPADTTATPEVLAIGVDSAQQACDALADMKGPEGRILLMMFVEQADRHEILRCFGITGGYLRVVVHRARLRLRQKVGKYRRGSAEPAG